MCDRMTEEVFQPETKGTTSSVDGFPLHFTPIYVLLTLRPVCYFTFPVSCPREHTLVGSMD